ncbi:MAG: hypothetical protein PHC88_11590 [Terrimicrobiaceae bacterium]|nr:hypothetical protein [Terrimicrobiaceae bacterium]
MLRTVAAIGYQSVAWSLDSLDSVGDTKTPQYLFRRIATGSDADLDARSC